MKRVILLGIVILLITFGLGAEGQKEQTYPNKPITIIVPWAPGGLKPVMFETIKPLLSKELGVPIILVTKEGGGGAVGWKELQSMRADGYTIGAASNSIFGATHQTKGDVDYRNFTPIVSLTEDCASFTVNSDSQWKTFEEFFAYAQAHPKEVRVGNSGAGGIWHIATLIFNQITNTELLPVPFGGGGSAIIGLLGNHIEATSVTPGDMTATLPTGKLRILALASSKRNPFYPEVPTIKEAIGYDVVVNNWSGVVAPKGVPEEYLKILSDAFERVSKNPVYTEFLEKNRLTNDFKNKEEFTEVFNKDAVQMMEVLRALDK